MYKNSCLKKKKKQGERGRLQQVFHKGVYPRQQKHEIIFNLISFREIKIKTMRRHNNIPTRKAKMQKPESTKCWQGYRTRDLIHCWVERRLNWTQVLRFGHNLLKLKISIILDYSIQHLRLYPTEMHNQIFIQKHVLESSRKHYLIVPN